MMMDSQAIMDQVRKIVGTTVLIACRVVPVKKNKVVFKSFCGRSFNDSPRYIFEALKDIAPDGEYIWLMNEPKRIEIEGAEVVKRSSIKALYHMATAKIWVDNCRMMPYWMKKRNNQFYIQTWHGGVALKAIEADAADTLTESYLKRAKNDSKLADLLISECEKCTQNYREAFWYGGEILKSGSPRSDIFAQNIDEVRLKVYKTMGLKDTDKLVLYAPTFRDSKTLSCYQLDTERLLQAMEKRFPGEWKVAIRLHPNVSKLQNSIPYNERVLNGSIYPEMNELLMASDVLITDFSSSLFDAFHIRKKVFLYATDLHEYQKSERRLYYDMKDLPASFSESTEELEKNIEEFSEKVYYQRLEAFVKELGFYGDGHASETVASRIVEEMNK